jgi:hypothetical protein
MTVEKEGSRIESPPAGAKIKVRALLVWANDGAVMDTAAAVAPTPDMNVRRFIFIPPVIANNFTRRWQSYMSTRVVLIAIPAPKMSDAMSAPFPA